MTEGYKMDPELKSKWVEALRSGEYRQGRKSHLKDEFGGYCCIGVLGKISGISDDDMIKSYSILENHDPEKYVEYCDSQGEELDATLWGMNDGVAPLNRRKSFVEIADWIEENL